MTSLVATLLVAVSTAWAFGRVFEGKVPTLRLLAAGIVSALLAWSLERRSLLLAVTVSAALMVAAVGFFVFRDTTWHGLPTLETLRQAASAAAEVGEQARIQVAPTPAVPPLLLAGITAVWAAVFSCHSLAFRAGSPLLALVPPVALLAFADTVLEEFTKPLYGILFLVAALAVALADGLRRVQGWGPIWAGPGSRNQLTSPTGRGARRVAAGTVLVALVSPLLIPGFGSKAVFDLSRVNGGDGSINVNPLVSIGSQLNAAQPIEVFKVRTPRAMYWRMIALPDFDGTTWHPDLTDPGQELRDGVVPLERPAVASESITHEFEVISTLNYPWLATPYPPTSIITDRPVRWIAGTESAEVDEPLRAGDTYTVTSVVPQPDAETLQRLDSSSLPTDPALTRLPAGMPPRLLALAVRWTRNSPTIFEKVLAIQDHLGDSDAFTYSTHVNYTDDISTLVKFLFQTRRGFCQQYASAMAVLLRTIGIPARVAVGFTAGTETDVGVRTVSTTDLHSWVEVPFPGYGWLSFDPTPNFRDPASATYQISSAVRACDRTLGNCPGKPDNNDNIDPGRNNATPPPVNLHHRSGADPGSTESGAGITAPNGRSWIQRPAFVLGAFGLAAVAVLLSIPLARAVTRRRRLRRAGVDPRRLVLATYDVFTERAGVLGLGRDPGETPGEYRDRAEGSGRISPGGLDRLTRIAVRAAFSPHATSVDDAQDATSDAEQTLLELRRSTPMVRRVTGSYRLER